MQRIAVTSSQLKSVGFDADHMDIEFNPRKGSSEGATGPVYRYIGPKVKEHYDALIEESCKVDGSVGSYFIREVKPLYKADGIEHSYHRLADV